MKDFCSVDTIPEFQKGFLITIHKFMSDPRGKGNNYQIHGTTQEPMKQDSSSRCTDIGQSQDSAGSLQGARPEEQAHGDPQQSIRKPNEIFR